MSDPQVVVTLRRKRDQIENAIAAYEKRLLEARRDLAHVNATIQIFETSTDAGPVKPYQDIHRLFKRGEIVAICKDVIAREGPQDTRELSRAVMKAKGFGDDNELRKAIAFRIVQALRLQMKRGRIGDGGMRSNVRVWAAI